MVSVRTKRNGIGFLRRRRKGGFNLEQFGLILLTCVFVGFLVYSVYTSAKTIAQKHNNMIRKSDQQQFFAAVDSHSSLHLDRPEALENTDFMDVEAADIRKQLECEVLLNNHKAGILHGSLVYGVPEEDKFEAPNEAESPSFNSSSTIPGTTEQQKRRRLSLEGVPDQVLLDDVPNLELDDDEPGYMNEAPAVTAAHLFCIAAYSQDDEIVEYWKDKVVCPVQTNRDTHMSLLELWSTARSEITEGVVIAKTLSISAEKTITLAGKSLKIWAPPGDEGTDFMVDRLERESQSGVGIGRLHDNLGKDRVFVDVGSGLGYTAMAISILYPGTTVVSLEPAPTNWLLQELNWRCNDVEPPIAVLKEGVAPSTKTSQAAHFIWRPTSTSSTRAWSLNMEEEFKNSYRDEDFEFSVQLLPWHKLLVRAEIVDHTIDVLNLDCEGCEYNLIPSLTDMEYHGISSIIGELHWSYIPEFKRPSSKRASETHARLCEHEAFARDAMECCAYPHTPVHSTVSGEVLVQDNDHQPPIPITVEDLIGETICPGFEKWAEEKNLFGIESDWAWLQVDSMNRP